MAISRAFSPAASNGQNSRSRPGGMLAFTKPQSDCRPRASSTLPRISAELMPVLLLRISW